MALGSGNGERRSSRSRGGAARRKQRTIHKNEFEPFIKRKIPNFEILNEEALEIIEENAERILEEVGVKFVDNVKAVERWRSVGADCQGDLVRIPRGLARKLCSTAPAKIIQHARNPDRTVEIGGKSLVLAPVYGPPFVRDLSGGRRYATISDFEKFVKLIEYFNVLGSTMNCSYDGISGI